MSKLESGALVLYFLAMIMVQVVLHCDINVAEAKTNKPMVYMVGKENMWTSTPGRRIYPDGQTLVKGSILVFIYSSEIYNVVKVDKKGYDTCIGTKGQKYDRTGNTTVPLTEKGDFYFISYVNGSACFDGNMKIHVTVK